MRTVDSIAHIIEQDICSSEDVYHEYIERLREGLLTRDENSQNHFCVYFLPYNIQVKKVFLVHHKKSGWWLSPGGHVDKGETVFESLNREIHEELGVKDFFKDIQIPFFLTITPIENQKQPCKKHFDVWYLVPTDGKNFIIDSQEFFDTKWLTVEEAKKIVINPQNISALKILEKIFG